MYTFTKVIIINDVLLLIDQFELKLACVLMGGGGGIDIIAKKGNI